MARLFGFIIFTGLLFVPTELYAEVQVVADVPGEIVVYIEGTEVAKSVRMIAQDECGQRGALAKSYRATSETLLEIECDDGQISQTPKLNSMLRQAGRMSCAKEHSGLYELYYDFSSREAVGKHRVRVECGSYDELNYSE